MLPDNRHTKAGTQKCRLDEFLVNVILANTKRKEIYWKITVSMINQRNAKNHAIESKRIEF